MPAPVIRITVKGKDHLRVLQQFPDVAAATIQQTTQTVMNDIVWSRVKSNLMGMVLKQRTGALIRDVADSIQVRRTFKGVQGTIGTSLIYGMAWELGATFPAYTIRPAKASFLRFVGGRDGATVFARKVERPARSQEARPFISEAFEARMEEIERAYAADMNRLASQLGGA